MKLISIFILFLFIPTILYGLNLPSIFEDDYYEEDYFEKKYNKFLIAEINPNAKINIALGLTIIPEKDLWEYKLQINKNIFKTERDGILNNENILYVYTSKNEIYCYPLDITENRRQRMSHLSLGFNVEVISAGTLNIKNGKLKQIINNNVDYKLDKVQFFQIIIGIINNGCNISDIGTSLNDSNIINVYA